MRVLFTSAQRSGAFVMRGEQIAATRPGWAAIMAPGSADLDGCDALVAVKKPDLTVLGEARARGIPIIYDALDFWQQVKSRWRRPSSAQRLTDADGARRLFKNHFATIAPDLVICVTGRMAGDLAPLAPTACVPHHADPHLPEAGAYHDQPAGRTLLYFGKRSFLQEWEPRIRRACRRQDIEFNACDVGHAGFATPPPARAMIAVRGGRDGCWLSRRWKSNVKAATAARLGLPLVAWPEAAYVETAPEAYWFTDADELETALEGAMSPEARPVSATCMPGDTARAYEALLAGHFGISRPDGPENDKV